MKETIAVLHQGIDSRRKDLTIDNACQVRDNLLASLADLGYKGISVFLDDRFEWAQRILDAKPDLVANVADLGFFYDNAFEPNIPAVLDGLKVNYTGSQSYSMFFSSDKLASKRYLASLGIPVPGVWSLDQRNESMEFPVILKYRMIHNSVGISVDSVAVDRRMLDEWIASLRHGPHSKQDEPIVEEYIDGAELCAGYIGNGKERELLPVVSFQFGESFNGRPRIRDFSAKWDSQTTEYKETCASFAALEEKTVRKVEEYVHRIADAFGIRDYARLDFRLKKNEAGEDIPLIIDVNANPDLNTNATLFKMAQYAGYDYTTYVGRVVDAALARDLSRVGRASRRSSAGRG
jgi:D-alanine-D-alanine ligase